MCFEQPEQTTFKKTVVLSRETRGRRRKTGAAPPPYHMGRSAHIVQIFNSFQHQLVINTGHFQTVMNLRFYF
jgi:hypothetical protein